MTLEEPVYVCINSSQELRDEQAIAGQLWIQGNRHMTASNTVPEGMADTSDSALLAAAAEAVSWNHASQPDQPRKGKRVIIFPKELVQLEEFLATVDPNVDPEDGHPIAYAKILEEAQKFELAPRFIKEDSEVVANDPVLSANVPEWMAKAQQVATGSHRRVLENGRDIENSEDEDDEDMKPDELHNMYTAEMDPKEGPKVLTPSEVAYQRAAGRALKSAIQPPPTPERKPTPLTSPTNSDEEEMSADQSRALGLAKKMAGRATKISTTPANTRCSDPTVQAPAKAAPLEIKTTPKAAASPRAPADQPKGTKVSPPTKEQQAPKHPMETRKRAKQRSGAGGFRPGVGGSGQTDTCVASSHPFQT
jgi:hypothetical protein